jgi:hypothetical protein
MMGGAFFFSLPGFTAQRRSHDVHHQGHGQCPIHQKSDDCAQYSALGTKGFSQAHEQGDIQPGNNDQIHYFRLCNLGDNKLTDTRIFKHQKNNSSGDMA